jgi:hypothetical protein
MTLLHVFRRVILREVAALFSNCIVPSTESQSNFVNINNCKLLIRIVAIVTKAPEGKHYESQQLLLQIYREAKYTKFQLVTKI